MTFRAIIVGGGPVGLAMARSLQLAEIDYVVLERNADITPEMGFGISLYPQSMRLMDQFGLLQEATEQGWNYAYKHNYSPEGKVVEDNTMMGMVKEYHGHPWQYMPRRTLLKMLYESNPDRKTKIRTGTKATSIKIHDKGVEVICADGTIETGSIVIGCDGIRSIARTEMDRIAKESTGRPVNGPNPFKVQYKALIGRSTMPEDLELGHAHETRGKHHAYQVMPSEMGLWWFVYSRVEPGHEEQRYTEADAQREADLRRNEVIAPGGLTFGKLWDTRIDGSLWDLHEGSITKWHYGGRIVLVGDAVHKFSPTAGNGLNTGWQGVSELANLVRREVLKEPAPSSNSLEQAFKTYQSRRQWISKIAETISWTYPRTIAWHNPVYKFIEAISPSLGGDVTIFKILSKPCIRSAVVLEYVEESNLPPGKKPWKNPPPRLTKTEVVMQD